jgi:ATP-dependent RNA helicase DDX51/DBP6
MFSSRYLGEDDAPEEHNDQQLEQEFEQRLKKKRGAKQRDTDDAGEEEKEAEAGDEDDAMQFEQLEAPKEKAKKRSKRLRQTLPPWLANPIAVATAITDTTKRPLDEFDLQPKLAAALQRQGITTLFPIQATVVPMLLEREQATSHPGDLCITSPTGSGKTLSYVLPILNTLSQRTRPRLQALIVLPTRQLVSQVFKVMTGLASYRGFCDGRAPLQIDALTGQTSLANEQAMLTKAGSDVIIATPGRLVDHLLKTGRLERVCVPVLCHNQSAVQLGFISSTCAIWSWTKPIGACL